MGDVAGLDAVDVGTELLAVTVLEHARGAAARGAHHEDVLFGQLGAMALEREGKGHGDKADLVLGERGAVVLGKHSGAIERHGIGERIAAADVGEDRVVDVQVVAQAHDERNDMAREIHAQLKVVPEVVAERLPHDLEHLGDDAPDLLGDDEAGFLPLLALERGVGVGDHLFAGQVDGDVAPLALGELHAELILDARGNTRGHVGHAIVADARVGTQVDGHVVALLDAHERDGDMHEQVLVGERVDLEVELIDGGVDDLGDLVERGHAARAGLGALDDACFVAPPGERFSGCGLLAREGLHHRARQAEAARELLADHADAVVRALLDLEAELLQALLHALEITRDGGARDAEGMAELVDRHPVGAIEQVVEKIGHAVLGLHVAAGDVHVHRLEPCVERRAVGHLDRVAAAILFDQAGESIEALVGALDVRADGALAHVKMLAQVRR